jgi:hypothetical protein
MQPRTTPSPNAPVAATIHLAGVASSAGEGLPISTPPPSLSFPSIEIYNTRRGAAAPSAELVYCKDTQKL